MIETFILGNMGGGGGQFHHSGVGLGHPSNAPLTMAWNVNTDLPSLPLEMSFENDE